MSSNVAMGDVEHLLLELGFTAERTADTHRLYRHQPSGAVVVLSSDGAEEGVALGPLVAIRNTLVGKGIVDAGTFDLKLKGYYRIREWLVKIKGNVADLEEFYRRLQQPALRVVKENGHYYLKSEDFNLLTDDMEVRAHAIALLESINGFMCLKAGYLQPVEIDEEIIRIGEDGTRWATVGKALTMRFRIKAADIDTIPIESCLELAENDHNVRDALRLLGNYQHSWFTLYKVYEIIKRDVGGIREIEKEGWSTQKEVKRFTHTANSKEILGDAARHGVQTTQLPSDPIALPEAVMLIRRLLNGWLRWKNARREQSPLS
jgi:predicted RNA binding protein YcfA (HicA-like mRNA interferase family)